ncbi:hypothetical protein [Noviherbaspirillum suwonense]|uniref:Uncharacterized protein n=1 Tax=Noviherbaspirillum suwonense TaxID=1224511 RepID=A0ABY1PYU2_9BURK|nr:hypothetical protein [Noviherbaspirillum suwonense]SMP53401.1 hypothetical protein SAMN06295970_103284 [Noviherbaspirillum suwonense]
MRPHGRVPMPAWHGDCFPAALCAGVALPGAWRGPMPATGWRRKRAGASLRPICV